MVGGEKERGQIDDLRGAVTVVVEREREEFLPRLSHAPY